MIEGETSQSSGLRPWIRKRELGYSNPLGRFLPDPLSRGELVPSLLFVVVGFLCLSLSCVTYLKTRDFLSNAITTTATVSRLEQEQAVSKGSANRAKKQPRTFSYLTFSDSTGQRHEVRTNTRATVGQQFNIRYLPSNPQELVLDNQNPWIVSVGLALIGGVSLLFGLGWLMRAKVRRAAALNLMQHGMKVDALVTEIKKRTWRKHIVSKPRVTVLGMTASQYSTKRVQSDFALQAEWTDPRSGKKITFISNRILFEPAPEVVGKKVVVFVDPSDPQNFYFGSNSIAAIC